MGHIPSHIVSKFSNLASTKCSVTFDVCPLEKLCKLPFNLSTSQAVLPFALIRCDLWGPYRISTSNGCKYSLTLIDNCTRAVWTILLPAKQYVIQSIKDFFVYVAAQFNTSIQIFCTNNGGQFMNNDLLLSFPVMALYTNHLVLLFPNKMRE